MFATSVIRTHHIKSAQLGDSVEAKCSADGSSTPSPLLFSSSAWQVNVERHFACDFDCILVHNFGDFRPKTKQKIPAVCVAFYLFVSHTLDC